MGVANIWVFMWGHCSLLPSTCKHLEKRTNQPKLHLLMDQTEHLIKNQTLDLDKVAQIWSVTSWESLVSVTGACNRTNGDLNQLLTISFCFVLQVHVNMI